MIAEKHKLIDDAAGKCINMVAGVIRAGHPAYQAVEDSCNILSEAIESTAPGSADKTAALRCVALARMAANDCIKNTGSDDLSFEFNVFMHNALMAKYNANRSITLHNWE
jgi:hypothetical protein